MRPASPRVSLSQPGAAVTTATRLPFQAPAHQVTGQRSTCARERLARVPARAPPRCTRRAAQARAQN